jgi:hypothetical protein
MPFRVRHGEQDLEGSRWQPEISEPISRAIPRCAFDVRDLPYDTVLFQQRTPLIDQALIADVVRGLDVVAKRVV